MKNYPLFILFVFALISFFSPRIVWAAGSDGIVINEIVPNPSLGEVESIELFNPTDFDVELVDYTIEDNTSVPRKLDAYSIVSNDYLVLKKSTDFTFGLNNDADILILKKLGLTIDQVAYGKLATNAPVPSQGESIARMPNGQDTDNDAIDFLLQSSPTLGQKNLDKIVDPPSIPPVAPTNLKVDISKNTVIFSWINNDEQALAFEVVVIDENGDAVIDHEPLPDQTKMEYQAEFDWGSYSWQVVASNGTVAEDVIVDGPGFELVQPVYSKNIIINEVLPHPLIGKNEEFIELYNTGAEKIDLAGWFLDDIEGGSSPYEIPVGTFIEPSKYLVFTKSKTKLALNDNGDSARLLFPDKTLASICSYSEYASLDLAWARSADNVWQWTEKITPDAVNIIYLTPEEEIDGMGGAEEEKVMNTVPIEIKTGEFRDYNEKLVTLTGTIISTSGNTFYLDDSSGQAKVYIQDKTGIKKPPMHKGDIFKVIGVVNLYRNTWRILPQKQGDVELIKCIKSKLTMVQTESNSQTSQSNEVDQLVASQNPAQPRAPTLTEPILKQVRAAETIVPNLGSSEPKKNTFWFQLAKLLTGLALIFLILLIIKINKFPKVKVRGGHFGDDET